MRFLIKLILTIIIIAGAIYCYNYIYENYPCSLDNVVIKDCPVDDDQGQVLVLSFGIENFCINYDESSEEAFWLRIDSLVIKHSSTQKHKKYRSVVFDFYNECFHDCQKYQNKTSKDTSFLNEWGGCADKWVFGCVIRFENPGTYRLYSDKIKSLPIKENGKYNGFNRKIVLD